MIFFFDLFVLQLAERNRSLHFDQFGIKNPSSSLIRTEVINFLVINFVRGGHLFVFSILVHV